MWKKLKNRINKFLWEHSGKKKPMLPAGSIDTTLLRDQTLVFLDRLKAYIKEDPDSFRKMQLSSYYNSSCIPDFNEAISSTLYVLRLCNLYVLQYYIMYHFLIPTILEKNINELKAYVFGCGSMIDAISLSFALKENGSKVDVHYTGVDIAKWEASFSHPFDTSFIQKPLQKFWDDTKVFDGNLIFFPTVISELKEYPDETGEFCQGLEAVEMTSDYVFLMVSYRTKASYNKDWKLTDWQKIQKIIHTIEKKGYESSPLQFSIPDDWKTYLKSETAKAEDSREYPCYYLAPPYGSTTLHEIAPDFATLPDVYEYLTDPGNIRLNCPYYTDKKEQYLAKYKAVAEGSEKPDTVCRQSCPIICHPYPKVVLSNKNSPCFQIFVFHKI